MKNSFRFPLVRGAIADLPDSAALIIADQQRAIAAHQNAGRASPLEDRRHGAVGVSSAFTEKKARHEVFDRPGHAIRKRDEDHFVSAGGRASPRAMQRNE